MNIQFAFNKFRIQNSGTITAFYSHIQWNLCNPIPEFSDNLRYLTQIYGHKVFLLTKIKPEYSDILYNLTHFPVSNLTLYNVSANTVWFFPFLSPLTNLHKHKIHLYYRGQLLHWIKHQCSESLKFNNYQRFIKRFVGLSDCQTKREWD
jgi:hypothetical protein